MKNQVIEALTPDHGAKVIEYWKSRGFDTRHLVGTSCKSDGDSYRYYGVIDGEFDNYTLRQVEKANAEIIELPSIGGYVFNVPTAELSRAIQVRLIQLGYRWLYGRDSVSENKHLLYLFAKKDGIISRDSVLAPEKADKYIKGSIDDLFYTDEYKYTPPKIIMELTMEEIAEKLGVDQVIIKS